MNVAVMLRKSELKPNKDKEGEKLEPMPQQSKIHKREQYRSQQATLQRIKTKRERERFSSFTFSEQPCSAHLSL